MCMQTHREKTEREREPETPQQAVHQVIVALNARVCLKALLEFHIQNPSHTGQICKIQLGLFGNTTTNC